MDKSKKLLIAKSSIVLLGILVLIVTIKYLPFILELTVSIDKFRNYILSMGGLGPLVFILFQVFQTVIAPIPGEVVQVAGGYLYGTWMGTIYTIVGLLIGAMIAFCFTRIIGRSVIEKILRRKKSQWMADVTDSNKFAIFLFVFFFIPGLPKDVLIYIAGLTSIKPLKFFGILLAGRLPWLIASVSVGANIYQKNYTATLVISAIALLGFILGLIFKDKMINKFSKLDKRSE